MSVTKERTSISKNNQDNEATASIEYAQESTEGEPRAWREEEQVFPENNIPLVFFSLLLTTFLVCIMLYMFDS